MKFFFSVLILLFMQTSGYIIWEASKDIENKWRIVNDGVMGGLSTSTIVLSNNTAKFSGHVSLDNNGGFAMTQYDCEIKVKDYTKLVVRLKGDGKTYQLRLRSNRRDYYSYVQNFKTSGIEQDIILDLNDFYPAFRGRTLEMPNFDQEQIVQIAFLIGNKIDEDFTLDIVSVGLR